MPHRVLLLLFLLSLSVFGQRPPPSMRRFTSVAVNSFIQNLTSRLADPEIATMFEACYPNTLDTTVYYQPSQGDTFVITGDIMAMWLRDSTNQVLPYLRFVTADAQLDGMIRGLIRRQVESVLLDPYANAFNMDLAQSGGNQNDITTKPSYLGTTVDAMSKLIFERKFEVDSLLAFFKLSSRYWQHSGHNSVPFDSLFLQAVSTVLDVLEKRQNPQQSTRANPPDYTFQRTTPTPTDTLQKGVGGVFYGVGLLASPFRPSDDATTFPLHIPDNAMAVVELRRMSDVLQALQQPQLASRCSQLAQSIDDAIRNYATVTRNGTSRVYAYEVDGYGNALFMDDGNVPSLLSLPYLGYVNTSDPIYQSTRQLVLSSQFNPYYFSGIRLRGVGSPHTPTGNVWPMSLIIQCITSDDTSEIRYLLEAIKRSTAGTHFMHESVNVNRESDFTRPWFAWANSLFGELIINLVERYPEIMLK